MIAASHDVCVLGAGPAGCLTAIELSRLGFRVQLIHGAARPGRWPETASHLFSLVMRQLGLGEALGRAVIAPVGLERIQRDDHEIRHDPEGRSLLVDRVRLDAELRRAARDAGVEVVDCEAASPRRRQDGWDILHEGQDEPLSRARLLVNARGRRGMGAGAEIYGRGKVAAYHARAEAEGLEPYHTIVNETAGQWYWLVGLPDSEVRIVCLMTAGQRTADGARGHAAAALAAAGVTAHGSIEPLARGDATARRALEPAAQDLLRVGDAFLSVDPLSSSGLYVAAVSAVQAARVANTILRRPHDADLAADFYAASQLEMAQSFAADIEAQAEAPVPLEAGPGAGRGAALSDLFLAPGVQLEWGPTLCGDFIEARPMLELRSGRPMAVVEGWPIERFLAPLEAGGSLLDSLQQWPPVSAEVRRGMVERLIAQGIVAEARDQPPATACRSKLALPSGPYRGAMRMAPSRRTVSPLR